MLYPQASVHDPWALKAAGALAGVGSAGHRGALPGAPAGGRSRAALLAPGTEGSLTTWCHIFDHVDEATSAMRLRNTLHAQPKPDTCLCQSGPLTDTEEHPAPPHGCRKCLWGNRGPGACLLPLPGPCQQAVRRLALTTQARPRGASGLDPGSLGTRCLAHPSS